MGAGNYTTASATVRAVRCWSLPVSRGSLPVSRGFLAAFSPGAAVSRRSRNVFDRSRLAEIQPHVVVRSGFVAGGGVRSGSRHFNAVVKSCGAEIDRRSPDAGPEWMASPNRSAVVRCLLSGCAQSRPESGLLVIADGNHCVASAKTCTAIGQTCDVTGMH